jgi:hypothetical protein
VYVLERGKDKKREREMCVYVLERGKNKKKEREREMCVCMF